MKIRIKAPIKKRSGSTLVEVLMASGIGLTLFAIVGSVSIFSGRSMTSLSYYAELENQSRQTLNLMTTEIRQARDVKAYKTNDITLVDSDGSDLRYFWNPTNGILKRIKGREEADLLTGCNFLSFRIFQRNTIANTYEQYNATNNLTIKLIDLNWVCTRSMLGMRTNTESVQSAKVVIRKK